MIRINKISVCPGHLWLGFIFLISTQLLACAKTEKKILPASVPGLPGNRARSELGRPKDQLKDQPSQPAVPDRTSLDQMPLNPARGVTVGGQDVELYQGLSTQSQVAEGIPPHSLSPQWSLFIQGRRVVLLDCVFALRDGRLFLEEGFVQLADGRVLSLEESGLVLENGELALEDAQFETQNGQLVLPNGRISLQGSGLNQEAGPLALVDGRVVVENCQIVFQNCRIRLPDGRMVPIQDVQMELQGKGVSLGLEGGQLALGGKPLLLKHESFALLDGSLTLEDVLNALPSAAAPRMIRDGSVPSGRSSHSDGRSEAGSDPAEDLPFIVEVDSDFAAEELFARRSGRIVPAEQVQVDLDARKFAYGRLFLKGQKALDFADWIRRFPNPPQTLRRYQSVYTAAQSGRLSDRQARKFAEKYADRSSRVFSTFKAAYAYASGPYARRVFTPQDALKFADLKAAATEARERAEAVAHERQQE
jgi:hypothetical protein